MKRIASLFGLVLGGVGLVWLARPAQRMAPDTPTTEADGLGPVTERWYWLDVEESVLTPGEIVQRVLDDFPRVMPPVLAWTRKVRGHADQGRVGDRYFFMLLTRRAWVETDILTPEMFRNRTLRHHPESGWTIFRVQTQGARSCRLLIHSRARFSTRMDQLAYLLGMRGIQRLTWEIMLRRARAISGGHQIRAGHRTIEFPYALTMTPRVTP